MRNSKFGLIILIAGSMIISGCFNSGLFLSSNLTEVSIDQANYQIVATNVSGESKAGYLLGLSYSAGAVTNTLALARVSGEGMLYKEALEDLWRNFGQNHGDVEGKALALVNVRYDTDVLNLILYTEVKISIRADLVEFK
jgi:hypothetical protein